MPDPWVRMWQVTRPFGSLLGKVGFRMVVRGRESIPRGATVIAPNHYSFLDPPLVGMGLRRPIQFLATHDLWGQSRLLDTLINGFGAVPLRSEGRPIRALRRALGHLGQGGTVGVFPEGGRAPEFGSMPARPGAAWLAVRSGTPLVPVYIHGSEMSLSPRHPPFRFIPVALLVGAPLVPAEFGEGRAAVVGLTSAWEAEMAALRGSA